jgi:putative transposase
MTHVRTSPYYLQSNGKIERWHRTLKSTTIRPKCPESLGEAKDMVTAFVDGYNHERLHSAIGYITPADKLAGRAEAIWALRIEKQLGSAGQQQEDWLRQREVVSVVPDRRSSRFRRTSTGSSR